MSPHLISEQEITDPAMLAYRAGFGTWYRGPAQAHPYITIAGDGEHAEGALIADFADESAARWAFWRGFRAWAHVALRQGDHDLFVRTEPVVEVSPNGRYRVWGRFAAVPA